MMRMATQSWMDGHVPLQNPRWFGHVPKQSHAVRRKGTNHTLPTWPKYSWAKEGLGIGLEAARSNACQDPFHHWGNRQNKQFFQGQAVSEAELDFQGPPLNRSERSKSFLSLSLGSYLSLLRNRHLNLPFTLCLSREEAVRDMLITNDWKSLPGEISFDKEPDFP